MLDYLNKKVKVGKILGVTLLVLFALEFFVLTPLLVLGKMPEVFVVYESLFMSTLFVILMVYVVVYLKYFRLARKINKNHLEEELTSIDISTPTFAKAQIYCGKNYCFLKGPKWIIKYSDIKWIYGLVEKAYGITVSKSTVIWFQNRKSIIIKHLSGDEVLLFIEKYLLPNSPDLIIGIGKGQKELFDKNFPKGNKRVNEQLKKDSQSNSKQIIAETKPKANPIDKFMISQFPAIYFDSKDENYHSKYVDKLSALGISKDNAEKLFNFEVEAFSKRHDERMLSLDYTSAWLWTIGGPNLFEVDEDMSPDKIIEDKALTIGEMVKMIDEAEWHYHNSHEKLSDELYVEIYMWRSRGSGMENSYKYFEMVSETTGVPMADISKVVNDQIAHINKYKWDALKNY